MAPTIKTLQGEQCNTRQNKNRTWLMQRRNTEEMSGSVGFHGNNSSSLFFLWRLVLSFIDSFSKESLGIYHAVHAVWAKLSPSFSVLCSLFHTQTYGHSFHLSSTCSNHPHFTCVLTDSRLRLTFMECFLHTRPSMEENLILGSEASLMVICLRDKCSYLVFL